MIISKPFTFKTIKKILAKARPLKSLRLHHQFVYIYLSLNVKKWSLGSYVEEITKIMLVDVREILAVKLSI